jgi:hypothetical protein
MTTRATRPPSKAQPFPSQTTKPTASNGTEKGDKPNQSNHHEAAEQGEGKHSETAEPTTTHDDGTEPAENTRGTEATEHAQSEHNEAAERTRDGHSEAAEHDESGEEVLGLDVESIGLTVAPAAVSLLLAGLLLTISGRRVVLAVVIVALTFAALDLRESVHQASEARAGLLTIALLAAVAHLGVAALAGVSLWTPRYLAQP